MTKSIKGNILNPNAGIAADYSKQVIKLLDRFYADVKKEVVGTFNEVGLDHAMDASIASQSRITINRLLDKWVPVFNRLGKKYAERMVERTDRNAVFTLKNSLKSISEELSLKFEFDDRVYNILKASTEEAANLIRLIPQQLLGDVQGAVMRSITTGNGLQDLVPYMNEKYRQNKRHAHNVALDQTRKAYSGLTAGRMQSIGMTKFEWIHSGGGQHPRKEHQAMNGKIYDLNDPPFVGMMYGQEIYGKPGDLPNCRCKMRPIISFEE